MMRNTFLDTDVVLDFLLDREPFSNYVALIFTMGEKRQIKNFVSPLTFSNSYYILRKLAGHDKVIGNLKQLASIVEISTMNKKTVLLALNSGFKDFEDALQNFSAIQPDKTDVIITRNIKDYKNTELPVMTPETFIKTITK